MTSYGIRVRVKDPKTGKESLEWGRPTNGVPYQYITREQAENAARLWGDAFLLGDVWVEEIS